LWSTTVPAGAPCTERIFISLCVGKGGEERRLLRKSWDGIGCFVSVERPVLALGPFAFLDYLRRDALLSCLKACKVAPTLKIAAEGVSGNLPGNRFVHGRSCQKRVPAPFCGNYGVALVRISGLLGHASFGWLTNRCFIEKPSDAKCASARDFLFRWNVWLWSACFYRRIFLQALF
jgi:hypothetical protein